jgi:hypothetical protein
MDTALSCIPGRLAFVETEDEPLSLDGHDAVENGNAPTSSLAPKTRTVILTR